MGPGAMLVVVDRGYLAAEGKQRARTQWQTANVTRLRADMKLGSPDVTQSRVECPQGQRLA